MKRVSYGGVLAIREMKIQQFSHILTLSRVLSGNWKNNCFRIKLLQTLILICFSIVVKAQDVTFMLAHTNEKKWIGVDKTSTLNGLRSTNLVFHSNHKADIVPVNSHKNKVTTTWQLISGNTTKDDNIVVRLADIDYNVIFSKTSNGAEFMTLSWTKNDKVTSRSYYAE